MTLSDRAARDSVEVEQADQGDPKANVAGTSSPRPLRRHASDVRKLGCPWCGATVSAVYQSRVDGAGNVRRRRECGRCGHDYPTVELFDHSRFARELAAVGRRRIDVVGSSVQQTFDDVAGVGASGASGGKQEPMTAIQVDATPAGRRRPCPDDENDDEDADQPDDVSPGTAH